MLCMTTVASASEPIPRYSRHTAQEVACTHAALCSSPQLQTLVSALLLQLAKLLTAVLSGATPPQGKCICAQLYVFLALLAIFYWSHMPQAQSTALQPPPGTLWALPLHTPHSCNISGIIILHLGILSVMVWDPASGLPYWSDALNSPTNLHPLSDTMMVSLFCSYRILQPHMQQEVLWFQG